MARDRAELGEFLRSRRDRVTPAEIGLAPFPGPRRVPGLRREELAVAAGVSPDYYSRLEQGRQAHVSPEILDAVARALRLDDVERAHLHDLASPGRSAHHEEQSRPARADPGLLRVLTALHHLPAVVLGPRTEVLASTGLFGEVLGVRLEPGSSFDRYLFDNPAARERIVNWAEFAEASVAALRRETARRPHDRQLAALVHDLRRRADVAQWWSQHDVLDRRSLVKRIDHPVAGRLEFGIENLVEPHQPDQTLVVYTVEPGSATARVLPMLASWSSVPSDL